VRAFHSANSTGHSPEERFVPEDTQGPMDKKVVMESLFVLRIGPFNRRKNKIPIRMGRYKFDVDIVILEGCEGIDDRHPILGTSIREFVKRVEKPHYLDAYVGIDAAPETGQRTPGKAPKKKGAKEE